MGIVTEELPGGITRVLLDGSLDIAGAAAIDMRMNLLAGAHKAVLVDLQKVTFLGSMGLRSLVTPARTLRTRGGRMVLFAPTEMVERVLTTSGIDTLIPIHHDLDAAIAALK